MEQDVIDAVNEFRMLLRQDAQRDIVIERRLLNEVDIRPVIEAMSPKMRERQRDYAVMLRMTDLIEKTFRAGGDWLGVHRRVQAYRQSFKLRNQKIDTELMALCRQVREGQ